MKDFDGMDLHIDKYFKDDGYYGKCGTYYESAFEYYQFEVFNFCGCGYPEEAMKYIFGIIELLYIRSENRLNNPSAWVEDSDKIENYFNSKGEEYFVLYLLNHLGIEEHGGSTPGWLTLHGLEVYEDLKDILN